MLIDSPVPEPLPSSPSPKRRRRRWPRVLLALFVLLLLTMWFAPAIVAKTSLRNWAARKALADLNGTVEIGGASAGWFAPIELRDITVKDTQGRTLLSVPRVTSSKTLFALLNNSSEVGEFVVEKPAIEIVCETRSTNLEDAFAKYLKDDGAAKPTRTAVSLRVHGCTLTIHDAGMAWHWNAVEAAVDIPASRAESLTAKVTAGASGELEADVSLGDHGQVKFVAAGFPLESLAPVLRRVQPGVSVGGKLTAGVSASWGKDDKDRPTVRIAGSVSARDLVVSGAKLKGDRFQLASVELPVKMTTIGNHVAVERAELTCDVGSVSVVGEFDPDEPLDKLLDNACVKFDADVDLAKLAALLPHLLRVREGTAIREGKLTAKLASRPSPAGTVWDGEVRTSALKATRDGKTIEWPEPLAVDFSGRVAGGGLPTFDKFVCKSDFVAVNAQGSPDSFRAAANVYLDRFAARMSDFLDLDGYRFDGQAVAWVIVNRTSTGDFKANGSVELKQFVFADRSGRGLREPELKLGVWLGGNIGDNKPTRLDMAVLTVAAGADTLDVRLVESIPDANKASAGRVLVGLNGNLAKWRERAAVFVAVPKHYVIAGTVKAAGTLTINPDTITAQKLTLGVQNIRFRGAGVDIDEPTMNAVGDLTVKRVAGSAAFTNVTLNSAPLSLTNATLSFEPDGKGDLMIGGGGDAVSDLNRLGKSLKIDPDPRGANALHGRGVGPLRFQNRGDTTSFGGTLDITNFAFGPPEKTGLYEPSLKVELDGVYRGTADEVRFTTAKLVRPGLTVAGKGTVAKFDTTLDVALDGTLTYDMAALSADIQKAVGSFDAKGRGTRPFSLSGSLSPGFGKTAAELALSWDSIRSHGFDVGASELKMTLARGALSVTPIKAAFGGGQIIATPTVRLDPEPAELSLAKGKLVDRAKLTPQVCASALGYALPLIAKATQAEGELTIIIDDNRVPLAAPEKALLKGQIVVHRAVVGAGPVMSEIAKLLGAQNTSMTLANEMTVPVKVENGRVHHENFRVTMNGYVVSTSGSVGFDGTMAVVADVPIPGTFPLLKNNPSVAKSLVGKIVKVPIGGTVSHPQLDARAFQTSVEGLLRDALKDVVKDAGTDFLKKELDKVMPKNLPGGLPFPFPKR